MRKHILAAVLINEQLVILQLRTQLSSRSRHCDVTEVHLNVMSRRTVRQNCYKNRSYILQKEICYI
jgi:hypothetical protein